MGNCMQNSNKTQKQKNINQNKQQQLQNSNTPTDSTEVKKNEQKQPSQIQQQVAKKSGIKSFNLVEVQNKQLEEQNVKYIQIVKKDFELKDSNQAKFMVRRSHVQIDQNSCN